MKTDDELFSLAMHSPRNGCALQRMTGVNSGLTAAAMNMFGMSHAKAWGIIAGHDTAKNHHLGLSLGSDDIWTELTGTRARDLKETYPDEYMSGFTLGKRVFLAIISERVASDD